MKQDLEHILTGLRTHPDSLPREEFVKNARIRVLNLVSKTTGFTSDAPKRRFWLPVRFATVGLLGGLMFGTGVVYAAQSSLPGSALYPIKVASETVALGLAPTREMKTTVAGAVIDRRAEEVTELKSYATSKEVSGAVSEYQRAVSDIRTMRDLNQAKIEEHIREHESLFDSEKEESSKAGKRHRDEERVSPPVPTVTPRQTVTPSTENKDESRPINTSGVLGAHEEDTKQKDDDYHRD